MGKDKLEKKRLKAQVKAEKARAKMGGERPAPAQKTEPLPWHKDPNWIRAIIAIATLVVMIISLWLTLYL